MRCPPDVVLRLDVGACLGTCRPYVAEVRDDGSVTLNREGETRQWRVSEEALTFALGRARCLANGPSYPEAMVSDGQRFELWVREGEGVATYIEQSADTRAPNDQHERSRELEEALRIRQGIAGLEGGRTGSRSSRTVPATARVVRTGNG